MERISYASLLEFPTLSCGAVVFVATMACVLALLLLNCTVGNCGGGWMTADLCGVGVAQ